MSYLVIHIDEEYIVGTVCTDNGNSVPIKNGDEDLLWLYFFNDPHQDLVSFGKGNKQHYRKGEVNYYGDFFAELLKDTGSFTLRGIKKTIIDLLDSSNLLRLLVDQYHKITHSTDSSIPTLITFSLSISDLAKQKTIDYLKGHSFDIKSYTIPLSELVCYYPFDKRKFTPAKGSMSLLLAATNSTLYVMKLVFSGDYFIIDGEYKKYKGEGIDPRKRAIVKFVVNKINIAVGALRSDEIEDECIKKDILADEWLKLLDTQNLNRPTRICDSLTPMPHSFREVLVKKSDVESDTGAYVQRLIDILDTFKQDNLSGDAAGVFLLGNCFNNNMVKNRFEERYKNNSELFFYADKDIRDILSIYPKLPYDKYKDEESRIKQLALAEERKLAEQREIEDKKRKEEERIEAEKNILLQLEENRRRAEEFYSRALELETAGQLEDAKVNAENAKLLDRDNLSYKNYYIEICQKINNLNEKNNLYKALLKDGEDLASKGNYKDAIVKYEAAKGIFDNAEIIKLIIDVKAKNNKFEELYSEAVKLFNSKDWQSAEEKISECTKLCPNDKTAQALSDKIKKEIEAVKIQGMIDEINNLIDKGEFNEAEKKMDELRNLDPTNKFITEAENKIKRLIDEKNKKLENEKKQKEILELVCKGDKFYDIKDYNEAMILYTKALALDCNNGDIKLKIKDCEDIIQENKIQQEIHDLTVKYNAAIDNKDFISAKDVCAKLAEIDKNNSKQFSDELERLSYLCNLSSARYVKGEIADVKVVLREGKIEHGKDKISKLIDNLHYIGCYDYDDELNCMISSVDSQNHSTNKNTHNTQSPPNNDKKNSTISKEEISIRQLRGILAETKAKIRNGNYSEACDDIDNIEQKYNLDTVCLNLLKETKSLIPDIKHSSTVKSDGNKVSKEIDNNEILITNTNTKTVLSEREIIAAKREIRALISTKKYQDAIIKLKAIAKKMSTEDFQNHGFNELLKKTNNS